MKKVLSMGMVLMLLLAICSVNVFAAEEATVYVTIADENGKLVLTQQAVTVTDTDNDGALTVNDALYAAHEAAYEGGAEEGYATSVTQYGISMDKLWGAANGGSYGYYVNNASAMSLVDPIQDGDYINAFVYTDLINWSDAYCYFDVYTVTANAGEEITLTLLMAGYDANWNPITVPVADVTITFNGEATAYKTDAEGKVTLKVEKAGKCVISATSETQTLVPPVCMATVETVTTEEPAVTAQPTVSEQPTIASSPEAETAKPAPDTGDNDDEILKYLIIAVVALVVIVLLFITRKKPDEK